MDKASLPCQHLVQLQDDLQHNPDHGFMQRFYTCVLRKRLLVSSSSKGLHKCSLPQEHHCQAGGSGNPPSLITT